MTAKKTVLIAAALLTMATAGCSRSADDPSPPENGAEAPMVSEPAPALSDTPEPLPTPSETPNANVTAAVPAAVPPAPDEQMMDDASATGMTARASRDEPSTNEAIPVEQGERK